MKKTLLAIWKGIKSNSAALIIGIAIIVGLNFPFFLSNAQSLWYVVSGQAARDRESFQQAEKLQAKILQDRNAMTDAWNAFLRASRGNDNPEIKLSKGSGEDSDYMCLENTITKDREDHFADMFVQWLNQNAILGRSDWKYEFLDNDFFSDAGTRASAINIQTMARYVRGNDFCKAPRYLYRRNRYQQLEH